MSIVFKPGRLENSIKVEGIHGTPKESKVTLDGYGLICICHVYIPMYTSKYPNDSVVPDGVLVDHGFQLRKSKGKVDLKPLPAGSTWLSLSLDPDGRAYLYENLFSKPKLSIFSLRDTPTSKDIWHARLGHQSYRYLEAMRRFP